MLDFLFRYIWTPFVVFVLGYIILRLMGKKAVAEMTGFELLAVLIIGTSITEPIVTKRLGIASYYSISIAILYIIFSKLSLINSLKKYLSPSPTVLIRGGEIDELGLKDERIAVEEVISVVREKGYTSISDVDIMTLEQTGKFSIIPKATARPIQPSDIQLTPKPTFIDIPLIMDGTILGHNLKFLNLNLNWLKGQLQANSLSEDQFDEITLAVYTQEGTVRVDRKDKSSGNAGKYNYKPGFHN